MPDLDELAEALYSAPPADFVATRDAAVRAARERGDREFAAAAARLRRPTRAAWLANLLVRRRREQFDGLLALAGSLADAQRTLDGDALRTLSQRRRQLVAAMAREAGRLARAEHEPVTDALLRELGDILEAALADPVVADEVRTGRLTRTITYSGFGPDSDPGAAATRAAERAAAPPAPVIGGDPDQQDGPDQQEDPAERARREREHAARERKRAERRRDLDDAETAEAAARERRDAAEAAHEEAAQEHERARDRVVTLTAELDAAQRHERTAAVQSREAAGRARAAAREAGTAATRTARARARLDDAGN